MQQSVSVDQQDIFLKRYRDLAQSCADRLRISLYIVLGQWALESSWGTEWYVNSTHNLAGIMQGSTVAAFRTPEDFANAYVASMAADCPALSHPGSYNEYNAAEIFAGTSYNTVNGSYAALIQTLANQVANTLQYHAAVVDAAAVVEAAPTAEVDHAASPDHVDVVNGDLTMTMVFPAWDVTAVDLKEGVVHLAYKWRE